MQSARSELEHLLSQPPPSLQAIHRHNRIAIAHAALEALRNAGDTQHLFLRTILEIIPPTAAKDEELLFHCITGVRQVVLHKWTVHHHVTFIRILRDTFMVWGHQLLQQGHRTTSLACYTTAVSFWKRVWNDDVNETLQQQQQSPPSAAEQALLQRMTAFQAPVLNNPKDLFAHLKHLLQDDSTTVQAATFLSCLLGEFVGKSAVSYRLPLEFHKNAHRSFEKDALLETLRLSMQSLSRVVAPAPTTTNTTALHAVVQLVIDVLSWEFGMSAWTSSSALGAARMGQTVVRPPVEWRDYLVGPDLARALFRVHQQQQQNYPQVAHSIRQLLLVLASLSGPIFAQPTERQAYAANLVAGTLELFRTVQLQDYDSTLLLDALQLVGRLIANFRLSTLVSLSSSFLPLLQGLTAVGTQLLADQLRECEQAGGDVEAMEHREWREEALSVALEGAVLLCGDPWLLYSGTEESRKESQHQLSTVLGPLYEGFVRTRTRMAALEEHYLVSHETELDEVREEILESDMEEELASIASLGRLNLSAAIACLSALFTSTMPQLETLWHGSGGVNPDTAALLEQARLLNLHVTYLLTDNNEGEAPSIPDSILIAGRENPGLAAEIASAVQALFTFADAQVHKIAEDPSNLRLSPLLASSFLLFLNRWAPAYVYPADCGSTQGSNQIVQEWSTPENAQHAVTFCVSLCLHYQSYWPQERHVQELAGQLLLSLAKRGGRLRSIMIASPVFQRMVHFHCLTAGIRHSASRQEFEAEIRSKGGDVATSSIAMIWGYQRLPYDHKSRILTAILVACSDTKDEMANKMINESLKAIHDAFSALIQALSSRQRSFEEIHCKEVACLCLEMLCGVAQASEMADPERIPQLLTGYLPQLSGLMKHYASDLTICETLLRFFRYYTEYFIATLDREQSLALFNASAELLKSYSAHHCASRAVVTRKSATEVEAEEDQAYGDILCAIQLLINLGTKDFIDACSAERGVDSSQVTDMIFFGLQQILPLMTQGLLQFPSLCSVFFDLIGFMNDTYPEKVCVLPYDLFNSLLESLLFGMSHHDGHVAKCSLYGLSSIAKEHLSSQVLKPHMDLHPDIFDRCTRRLLTEVVFQQVVVDRVEAAGMALLPLIAVNMDRFAAVVQELKNQVPDVHQQNRLQVAFNKLIQPEALAKVSAGGYEGRMNRAQFKKQFEEFVNEVHSFLVLR